MTRRTLAVIIPTLGQSPLLEGICRWVETQDVDQRILCGTPPNQGYEDWEREETPAGFGVAANGGAVVAKTTYLLFLNDDVEVLQGEIQDWITALEEREELFAIVPQLMGPEGEEGGMGFIRKRGRPWPRPQLRPLPGLSAYPTGAAFLVRRDKWEELGGFSGDFHPAYWEDADLGLRAWKKGWATWQTGEIHLYHHRGTTTSTWNKSVLTGRFLRGQRRFAARHAQALGLPWWWWGSELLSQGKDFATGKWRRLMIRWGWLE
ncbi:glycosyltransferase family 2 protein [bacterium]|nr:glycosyltransferase family 2 protein [bacterium]